MHLALTRIYHSLADGVTGSIVTTGCATGVQKIRIESRRNNNNSRVGIWSHTSFKQMLKKQTTYVTYYNCYLSQFFAEWPSKAAERQWSSTDPALWLHNTRPLAPARIRQGLEISWKLDILGLCKCRTSCVILSVPVGAYASQVPRFSKKHW